MLAIEQRRARGSSVRGSVFLKLSLVIAGCGRVGFGSVGSDASDSDGHGSARDCVSPGLAVAFADFAQPCGDWGSVTMQGASVVVNGDALEVTPATSNSFGGCTSTNAIDVGHDGVFAHITQTLVSDQDAYTVLQLFALDGSARVDMVASNGLMSLSVLVQTVGQQEATVAFDSALVQWWRVRFEDASTVFDLATDGHDWSEVARIDIRPVATSVINVGAGLNSLIIAPGTARFVSVDVCP